jgi:hypothetical protein
MPTSPSSAPDLTDILRGMNDRLRRLERTTTLAVPDPTSGIIADLTVTGLGNAVTRYTDSVTNQPRTSVTWTWTNNVVSTNDDPTFDQAKKYQVSLTTPTSTIDVWRDVEGATFSQDNLPLNINATLKVRAVAWSNRIGPTATNVANTSKDSVPPPQPSTPTVVPALKGVRITWNGLDVSAAAMPVDLAYVEIHASTSGPTFTPAAATLQASRFYPGGGSTSIVTVDYNLTYVRLVPYDTSGNAGPASTAASATPAQAVNTDLGVALPGDIAFSDEGNLVLDGSFESTLIRADRTVNGSIIGDVAFGNTAGLSSHGTWYVRSVGDGNTTKQLYLCSNTMANTFEIPVGAYSNQKLYVGMKIRGISANGSASLVLRWTDSAGGTTFTTAVTTSTSTGSYVLFEAVIPVPSTAVSMNPRITTSSQTAGTWYFDAVQIRTVVPTLLVDDAAITNAKIADLSVNDAKISNLSGGKIDALSVKTDALQLGVLRTNMINNHSFEEAGGVAYTQWTDPGQGNVNNWRRSSSNISVCDAYSSSGRTRTGTWHGNLLLSTGGTTADYADLYSNTILLKAGVTYKVTWYAVCNGTGVGAGANMLVDALFGPSQTAVGTATMITLTDGAPVVVPFVAYSSTTGLSYQQYSAELAIPGGQTDLWCSVRFRMVNNAATAAIMLEDVSLLEVGVGGGVAFGANGLRVFDADGDPVIEIVSNLPNRIGIMDENGNTAAAMDQTGGITATRFSVIEDPTVDGRPLVGLMGDSIPFDLRTNAVDDPTRDYDQYPVGIIEAYSKGTVQWQIFDPALLNKTVAANGAYVLYDVAFDVEPGRQYTPFQSGITVAGANGNTAGLLMRYTTDNSIPGTGSVALCRFYADMGATNNTVVWMPMGRLFNGVAGQEQIRIAGILYAFGGAMTITASDNFTVGLVDLGWVKNAEGRLVNSITTAGGPSTITKTYVSTWKANNSESYGNFGANTATNLYQGYYSSNQGHQWASILFTGANSTGGQAGITIATAMTGATLKKAELWLRSDQFYYNSGGTLVIRAQTSTSLITTTPAGTAKNASWAENQGKWVDITSIATSAIRGVTLGKAPDTNKIYYGQVRNHTSPYPPMLRLTYSKQS